MRTPLTPSNIAGENEPDLRPFCEACLHQHDADEPCLCPECGRPALEPGGTCGRPHA